LRTPTGPFFARFFIGIILDLVAEFAFMVPSTRMVLSSSAARWKSRKQIRGLKCLGAPHNELAMLISRISRRISNDTVGRPQWRRDFQRQYNARPIRKLESRPSGSAPA
jgi:hypothetical protein